jgi:hypothetical protein
MKTYFRTEGVLTFVRKNIFYRSLFLFRIIIDDTIFSINLVKTFVIYLLTVFCTKSLDFYTFDCALGSTIY